MTLAAEDCSPQGRFNDDLERAAAGDRAARDRLWSEHYETLRMCAKDWLAQKWQSRDNRADVSFGGTHIVNVAYERLRDRTAALEKGRAWFFRCFYTECLRIAVDHYRKTKNQKGRGELDRISLEWRELRDDRVDAEPDAIFDILEGLELQDSRAAQVAMIKIFETVPDPKKPGSMRGLTNGEVAELLDCGLRTVEKDWAFAKSYLMRALNDAASQ